MMIRLFASMPASVKACSKIRRWESVSSVEPDLEDTTMAVSASRSARAARTCSGSVLSSTVSSTPAVPAMTSGASEEPPMPHSTMRVTPSAFSASRSSRMSATRGCGDGGRLHPAQPDGGLGFGVRTPQGVVLREDPGGNAVLHQGGEVLLDGLRAAPVAS